MTHPHHDLPDAHASESTPGAVHDPVCGHWIVPEMAHGTSTYEGRTIHFCSTNCKHAFDAAPARFMPRYKPAPRFLDRIRPAAPAGKVLDKVLDPVCRMSIDPAKAAGMSAHEGKTYSFCSPGCKAKFDKEPAKYLAVGHQGGMR